MNENAEFSISTGEISDLNGNFAVASGKLRLTEGKVKRYGHCWSTYQGATIESDSKTDLGSSSSTKEFISEMNNLQPGIIYYVRSYAEGGKVEYGNEVPFYTPSVLIGSLDTLEISIHDITIQCHIKIYSGIVATYGFCWAEHDRPTIYDSKTEFTLLPDNGNFDYKFTQLVHQFTNTSI